MTEASRTSRDFCSVIFEQLEERSRSQRSLEVYLSRLRQLLVERLATAPLSAAAFTELLDAAFEGPPAEVDTAVLRELAGAESLPLWHRCLAQQIVDLREMDAAGILDEEYRYFGVDAPSGERWYNFDPHLFIECGLVGSRLLEDPMSEMATISRDELAHFLWCGQNYE